MAGRKPSLIDIASIRLEKDVFSKQALESCLEQLGRQLLDSEDVKAVMMSKDDNGDSIITLV
jgi:hypothetical protein